MPTYNPPTTLEQTAFQLYRDDISLNNATPLAPVNQEAEVLAGYRFRCRIQVESTTGWSGRLLLEYRVNEQGNWGNWAAADNDQFIQIVSSQYFVDGEDTTVRIGRPPGSTFVAGEGIETRRNSRPLTVGIDSYTEVEWNLIAVGLTVGTVVEMRVVSMTTAWSGGQNYTASPLQIYHQLGKITIGGSETYMMYEAYTEIGWGIEAPTNFGKFVPAVQKINATARLPDMAPVKVTYGGFRGIDAPINAVMGLMAPEPLTLTMEACPDQLGKLLASLFNNPVTTGSSAPYTHNFVPSSFITPRTLTIWQKEHYRSDEAGNPPLYAGYGGVQFSSLTLEAAAATGGILVVSADGMAATYVLHNSESTVGMNSAFGNAQPFTVESLQLELQDSTGATPPWQGEVEQVRLRLARGDLSPAYGFTGKAIAKGYRYRTAVHLVELSIQVYRTGLKPLKLVLGQPEDASYPLVPGEIFRVYSQTGASAALKLTFTSLENNAWKLIIATQQFGFMELTDTSGGEDPMVDTYTLLPLVSAGRTLSEVRLINANSTEPGASGTPITVPAGRYSP